MSIPMTRRQFGFAATAISLNAWSFRAAAAESTQVRVAIALRAAFQSAAWIGAEAGVFRRHGIDIAFLSLEAGGPQAATGTIDGKWEFCHTGDLPIVQGVLRGQDPVLILTPTELHDGVYVMARRDITRPEQLANAKVGAVDSTGQLGRAVQSLLQKWGVSATMVSLGSFRAIYAALGSGQVDAGYLPVDLRFLGENEFGWNALQGIPAGTGGIVTTRRFVAANRNTVSQFVRAYVETIALFKKQPDVVVPLLQRFLDVGDRRSVEQLYAFYMPLFKSVPRPTFFSEMPKLRQLVANQYPTATNLQEDELRDPSFIDDLERQGYMRQLYGGDAR